MSQFGFGTMMFGWRTGQTEADRLLAGAVDAGINLIDSSNSYGRGWSEEVLGNALRNGGARDRLVIATKFHFPVNDSDPNARGNNRRHIIQQCEQSLRRLGTEWIDLYQVHCPEPDVPIDETLRALDDLVRAGKVRYVGTSSFAAWQIVEGIWASKEFGLNRFVTEQPPYNLLDRRAERELFPMAQTFGIGIIVWSPLAQGILSGKYRANEPFPEGSRFAAITKSGLYGQRLTSSVAAVCNKVEEIARRKGCSATQLSLAWAGRNEAVSCVLIGPSSESQLIDNLGAIDVTFTTDELEEIDVVVPPEGVISPFYERPFSPHRHRI